MMAAHKYSKPTVSFDLTTSEGRRNVPQAGRTGCGDGYAHRPVLLGGTAGFDVRWSWYIAIGQIFRSSTNTAP